LYPLSSAAIKVASADAVLYVRVGSIYLKADQICFSSVEVQAFTYQDVSLEFSGNNVRAEVDLWHRHVGYSSNRSNHASRSFPILEEMAKAFVTAWNLDNKNVSGSEDPVPKPKARVDDVIAKRGYFGGPDSPTTPAAPKGKRSLEDIFAPQKQ
jgi:hypothetical protein